MSQTQAVPLHAVWTLTQRTASRLGGGVDAPGKVLLRLGKKPSQGSLYLQSLQAKPDWSLSVSMSPSAMDIFSLSPFPLCVSGS